ncbi:MAG: MarR family transcriptional regulator [Firmicutes bacterium HGW-Firmicutes-13]|nr:MAG: MarR family transcriptional regulator [Firmicutes bacterium HGW-Firmicutes-13]
MIPQESIGKYLSYIYRTSQCYIGKELEQYGIGSGQYTFLLALSQQDGVSQDKLTEMVKVDKATTGRAVKKLVEEGFVVRRRNPDDKRAYQLNLTPKGKRMLPFIQEVLFRWNSIFLKNFTVEERDVTLKLFKKIFENLSMDEK